MEDTVVKLNIPLSDEVIRLSALDQQAQRNYAKLLLIFKHDQATRHIDIATNLKQSLGVALSEVPDFGATVIPLPGSSRKELELRLGPDSGVPVRVVNHAADPAMPLSGRNYDDLAAENFPTAVITSESLFIPQATCEDTCANGIPALLVQINLFNGGLIIGLCWHHTVADARSVNDLCNSWARHTKALITQGTVPSPVTPTDESRERWRLEYGSRDVTIDDFPEYLIDRAARSPQSLAAGHLLDRHPPGCTPPVISTWYFSQTALKSLRNALAESGLDKVAQFTQSEAVSALIWKHMSIARQLDKVAPQGTSLFTTRVDYRGRAKPALDDKYVGNINEPNARARIPLEVVCAPSTPQSLTVLAGAIRDAVAGLDEKAMRDFIGLVNQLPAVTDLAWDYDTFPGPDLSITDLSGLDTLRQDWGGPLGLPSYIRSGSREKGLVYVLPQDQDGGFEVQLQGEEEVLDRLKEDKVFTQYASFRG